MNMKEFQRKELDYQQFVTSTLQDVKPSHYDINQCKIISFYAEKGGVCKTTNTVHLAFTFAEQGKRVLLYDCDPQRSLTAELLGLEMNNFLDATSPLTQLIDSVALNEGFHRTLYEQVNDDSNDVKPVQAIHIRENVWLAPGSRDMNSLDKMIQIHETMASFGDAMGYNQQNQKTGKPYASIIKTANQYGIDFVFLDLNPNKGILNRCLIFSSHYLIIPTVADFHSSEMMLSMYENLRTWYNEMDSAKTVSMQTTKPLIHFKFPDFYPKFLGFILNRIYSNEIGQIGENGIEKNRYRKVEEIWINKVKRGADKLTNMPRRRRLFISKNTYHRVKRTNNLGEIRYFYGLKNISDLVHVPVHFLEARHMIDYDEKNDIIKKKTSSQFKDCMEKIEKFKDVFFNIYKTIMLIIEEDSREIEN